MSLRIRTRVAVTGRPVDVAALERFVVEVGCDQCGAAITSADGLYVWNAVAAWSGDGDLALLHATCVDAYFRENFVRAEIDRIRTAPLAELPSALAAALGLAPSAAEQAQPRDRQRTRR